MHQFIQTTGKLNTQYHTEDYVLTIQQSSTGEWILSIEQKAAAVTNEPMTQLSGEDILQILNASPQPPTSLTSLPGTDMIPVPLTSVPSNAQPGTSAQGIFSPTDPQLPVPPPGILQHSQDLLKRHEALKSQPLQQPIAQPSGSGKSSKKEEEDMEVIDNDDDDDGQDQWKKKYIKKQHRKPVPPHLQNPKRSYCECGKSYSHGSDFKRHKLEQCGKTGRKWWVCPQCSKFIRHQSHREHYYKVHIKKEPYKWKVCNKKFFHNPNYTKHKKEYPEHTFSKKAWDDDL